MSTINVTNANVTTLNGGPLAGTRNRIINGDMRIDQRNAGASVTVTTAGNYTVDRWSGNGTQNSKYTIQQNAGSATPPLGFTNYLGVTSSSAYSVLTGDVFWIAQAVEGLNAADLGWGTANAKSVVLSFWVRSSLTGTFGGAIRNSAADRSYPFSYTISSANTWEQKAILIPGDTTGTWLTTNGVGLNLNFGLGSGATYSGTAGSWAAANYVTVTGATSVVGTNGATFYITGVQLEAGSVATPFERRSYGQELALCQRYYYRANATGGVAQIAWAQVVSPTTKMYAFFQYAVPMRATPSSIDYATLSASAYYGAAGNAITSMSIDGNTIGTQFAAIVANVASGFASTGAIALLTANSGAGYVGFNSEL